MTLLLFLLAFQTGDGSPFDYTREAKGDSYSLQIEFYNNGMRITEKHGGAADTVSVIFLRYAEIRRLYYDKSKPKNLQIHHLNGTYDLQLKDPENAETLLNWINGMITDGRGLL